MALAVHIWSDVVCPWCFVGKRRFEKALADFGQPVDVTWHSFELDPRGSHLGQDGLSAPERLARKLGAPVERARAMMEQMARTGEPEGIHFNLIDGKTGSSFDAHRLLHFAATEQKQGAMKERLLRAHFEEALDCSNKEVLARLAQEVGLDEGEARAVLSSDRFAEEVRSDEASAKELGISGVPFFVIGRYGISGAQSSATFLQVLDRAYVEQEPQQVDPVEGEVCTPEGCA
jgi:predicted DsbA family dithiol-disulfide isomerase